MCNVRDTGWVYLGMALDARRMLNALRRLEKHGTPFTEEERELFVGLVNALGTV